MREKRPGWSIGNLAMTLGMAVLVTALPARADEKTVTLQTLLREMSSRETIAHLPDPSYVCLEASSHDRHKVDPQEPKGWHSNKDYEQFIRTEKNDGRNEWVIMEHDGPGAIARMWLPLNGDRDKQVIRFYFDGSSTPAIAVKFNELLSGHGFVKPPLAFVAWNETDVRHQIGSPDTHRGVGGDLYLPIPFSKSCKITLDQMPFYYIINYRAYEPGTSVKTFSMADYRAAAPAIAQAAESLVAAPDLSAVPLNKHEMLSPGQELSLDLPPGSAALQRLLVKFDEGTDPQALRSTVLMATFDDESTVWCPLSEFFGAGVRWRPVSDRFRTVAADGTLMAEWVMPYEKTARLSLKNVGDKAVAVSLAAQTGGWRWDQRSLHFHANWHCQFDLKTRPISDWNYNEIKGQGSYVGDSLTVFSRVGAWYGEGDERVYVDGEKFPSHIGTGTEDYYGYAWGMAGFFSSPFISMPRRDSGGQDWRGYTTTSRLRVLDAIPFKSTLRHDMEVWNWADTKVDYAVGTFWYGRPGATSNREPQPQEAAAPIHEPPPDPRIKRVGALECEGLAVVGKSSGLKMETQDVSTISTGHWSEGKQLFVRAARVGDFVELQIPVTDQRPRKVILFATKSYDYGILRLSINGQAVSPNFEGFNAIPVDSGPIELGTFEPKDGNLVLRVEVTGSNPSAKGLFFGLDCVVLTKVQ